MIHFYNAIGSEILCLFESEQNAACNIFRIHENRDKDGNEIIITICIMHVFLILLLAAFLENLTDKKIFLVFPIINYLFLHTPYLHPKLAFFCFKRCTMF